MPGVQQATAVPGTTDRPTVALTGGDIMLGVLLHLTPPQAGDGERLLFDSAPWFGQVGFLAPA